MTSDRGKLRASTEPMTDCYYYIHKPGFRVFLTFTKFHFPSNVTNGTCDSSYIEVLVGRELVRNDTLGVPAYGFFTPSWNANTNLNCGLLIGDILLTLCTINIPSIIDA